VSAVNIDEIVETLSTLSVLEMSKLKVALEEKWGVKAQAAVAQVVASSAPAQEAAKGDSASEATEVKVTLEAVPADKKISVIKVIREVTGLGLKEAKDIVDASPKVVKESVSKAEGDDIAKKIEAAGGKVSLKGL
jgi:large subunit ribosomal protein L7/L12